MALILTEFQNSVFVHMEQTHKAGETFDFIIKMFKVN